MANTSISNTLLKSLSSAPRTQRRSSHKKRRSTFPREEKQSMMMKSIGRSSWKWLKKKRRSLSHRWWISSINLASLSKNSSRTLCITDRIRWNKWKWCRFNKPYNQQQVVMIIPRWPKKNASKTSRCKLIFRWNKWRRWWMTQTWRIKWLTCKICLRKSKWIWWWRLSLIKPKLKISFSQRQELRKNSSIYQLSNLSWRMIQNLEKLPLSHNLVPWQWCSKSKEEWEVVKEAHPWECSDMN